MQIDPRIIIVGDFNIPLTAIETNFPKQTLQDIKTQTDPTQ
jgi:hypothetical protein